MRIPSALYPRSTIVTDSSGGGGGGLGKNTIIFIVLGVVCLLIILIGFYLVSRPGSAYNASPNVPGLNLEPSSIAPPAPQYKRGMSENWKSWRIWHKANSANPPNTAEAPTSPISPPSITIARPSPVLRRKSGSKSYPPLEPRPSQSRRVTSLSVATSFSHSHITEEALSDFRASAYDLDGDLETEMLHSARDDVWLGHPLAVEDSCVDIIGEAIESRGNVTPIVEGSVEGDAPTRPAWGSDLGACQNVVPGGDAVEADMSGSIRWL